MPEVIILTSEAGTVHAAVADADRFVLANHLEFSRSGAVAFHGNGFFLGKLPTLGFEFALIEFLYVSVGRLGLENIRVKVRFDARAVTVDQRIAVQQARVL